MRRFLLCLSLALAPAWFPASGSATSLTVAEVRRRAVEFNRGYLSALEEVDNAQGEIIKARAGALPIISAGGSYTRNMTIPSVFFEVDNETSEFKMGYKNNFGASVSLQQPLYRGGQIFTALAIARLYKQYALAGVAQAKAEVVYNAEVLFYQAILEKSRLTVLDKALEANSYNLEVVEQMYSQGLVSEFEVLRARVERNNLLPQLIEAESDVQLSEKRLKSFLGIELDDEVVLLEETADTSLSNTPTRYEHIASALARRPEVSQAENLTEIAKKAIRVAKGAYYPSVDAVSAYEWSSQSDDFTLSDNTSKSFTAGIRVSVPIFLGGARSGEVRQRKVQHNQARLAAAQLTDDIRLEVEEAYDRLIQAKKALDIQGTNIAEAEEGLKIANVRYESGVGTLLEVMSAQVALTSARNAHAAAAFSFREARAKLKKASMIESGGE